MQMGDKPDVMSLPVLKQSAYVLQSFENGLTLKELTKLLEGETSLAKAYLIFFKQMECFKEDPFEKWFLTEKGKETLSYRRQRY